MSAVDGPLEAWRALGAPAWSPEPGREAAPGPCWLCGMPTATSGEAWRLKDFLTPTFTSHTLAAVPWSEAVCQPCVYLGSGDAWRAHCAGHPEEGLKSMPPLSWRSYSHVFAAGVHASPGRAQWREWLLEPPAPPFVLVLAESGKKHLIYRAQASHSRDTYWLQVEEDTVLIQREEFGAVLGTFEALLALGFSREEVRTGSYSQGRLLKVRREWEAIEPAMRDARSRAPDWVRICATVAHGPAKEEKAT